MLAGVVFLVDEILGLMNPAPYLDVMFVVAMLFVLAGMVGFHALQQGHYGRLGWAGFYAIVVGVLAQVLGLVLLLSGSMALLWLLPVATLAVLVGFALYRVAQGLQPSLLAPRPLRESLNKAALRLRDP